MRLAFTVALPMWPQGRPPRKCLWEREGILKDISGQEAAMSQGSWTVRKPSYTYWKTPRQWPTFFLLVILSLAGWLPLSTELALSLGWVLPIHLWGTHDILICLLCFSIAFSFQAGTSSQAFCFSLPWEFFRNRKQSVWR
jgi:hypothetical protein